MFVTFCKLVLQFSVAYGFSSRAHLSQYLLQTTHAADDASYTNKNTNQVSTVTAGNSSTNSLKAFILVCRFPGKQGVYSNLILINSSSDPEAFNILGLSTVRQSEMEHNLRGSAVMHHK